MSQAILEKALELGKKIAESDEFKDLQAKEKNMLQDKEAGRLLKSFQELQKEYQEKQMQGEQLTPADIKRFEAHETKMLENPLIREFYESQNKFQELLDTVNYTINQAMLEKRREVHGASCTPSG